MVEARLLRVPEAAIMAGVGNTVAYEFVSEGVWPSVKIGRSVRVPRIGLETWIEEREAEADARAAQKRGEAV